MSLSKSVSDAVDRLFAPHCRECGASCTRIYTKGFDAETGKPEWIYACPTRLKKHWGMDDCRLFRLDEDK